MTHSDDNEYLEISDALGSLVGNKPVNLRGAAERMTALSQATNSNQKYPPLSIEKYRELSNLCQAAASRNKYIALEQALQAQTMASVDPTTHDPPDKSDQDAMDLPSATDPVAKEIADSLITQIEEKEKQEESANAEQSIPSTSESSKAASDGGVQSQPDPKQGRPSSPEPQSPDQAPESQGAKPPDRPSDSELQQAMQNVLEILGDEYTNPSTNHYIFPPTWTVVALEEFLARYTLTRKVLKSAFYWLRDGVTIRAWISEIEFIIYHHLIVTGTYGMAIVSGDVREFHGDKIQATGLLIRHALIHFGRHYEYPSNLSFYEPPQNEPTLYPKDLLILAEQYQEKISGKKPGKPLDPTPTKAPHSTGNIYPGNANPAGEEDDEEYDFRADIDSALHELVDPALIEMRTQIVKSLEEAMHQQADRNQKIDAGQRIFMMNELSNNLEASLTTVVRKYMDGIHSHLKAGFEGINKRLDELNNRVASPEPLQEVIEKLQDDVSNQKSEFIRLANELSTLMRSTYDSTQMLKDLHLIIKSPSNSTLELQSGPDETSATMPVPRARVILPSKEVDSVPTSCYSSGKQDPEGQLSTSYDYSPEVYPLGRRSSAPSQSKSRDAGPSGQEYHTSPNQAKPTPLSSQRSGETSARYPQSSAYHPSSKAGDTQGSYLGRGFKDVNWY